jgi:hypothetical protein
MPPLEIQVFSPSMRYWPLPSGRAVVAMAATSDPASASDSAKAAIRLAFSHRRQDAGLQLVAAVEADRRAAQALHGEGEVGEPVLIGERLADEAERTHVEAVAGAAMGRRHGMGQQARFAERPHQRTAGRVGVLVVDQPRHLRRRPFGRLPGDLAVLGREGTAR